MPAETLRGPALLVLAALGYFGCAHIGHAYAVPPGGIVVVWPAGGFLLGCLLLSMPRDWPYLLIGGLAGNIGADMLHGASLIAALEGGAANGLETWLAAWVVIRLAGRPVTLTTLRQVAALVLGGALVSNAVTAFVGSAVLVHGWGTSAATAWLAWWIGDGLGMLLVTPFVVALSIVMKADAGISRRTMIEGALAFVALVFVSDLVLRRTPPLGGLTEPYVLLPLLFATVIRFKLFGASVAALVIGAATIWHAANGHGAFAGAGDSAASQAVRIYIYLATASLTGLFVSAMLSERERAYTQERMLAAILEATPDFVTIGRMDGPPLFVNRAARRALGVGPDETVPSLYQFRPIGFRELFETVAMPAAERDGSWSGEAEYVSRAGRVIPVSQVSVIHTDPDGKIAYISTISRDVTEHKALEEQLRQAQKIEAVGQLAGGLAHDFNNLLTAVLGYAQILEETFEPGDPRRLDTREIRKAGERASQLTRQLLAFSRKQILQPVVLGLNDVIDGIGRMLSRVVGEHIRLELKLDPHLARVKADPGQVEQILVNLAVNAADAMERGGTLTIETSNVDLDAAAARRANAPAPGPYVMLSVCDTGTGMTPETQLRIFEPFFTTKAVGKGTGMGLATVFGIAKQSGGTVTVRSKPGEGTIFNVYLPQTDEPKTGAAAQPPAVEHQGARTVLAVDDDPGVLTLVTAFLTRDGYTVLAAQDSETAMNLAASHDAIDLLLTDVVMPDVDGPTLFARLRSRQPALRVLYMSGYADSAIVDRGVLAPGTQFISKPFAGHALLTKVREALAGPEVLKQSPQQGGP